MSATSRFAPAAAVLGLVLAVFIAYHNSFEGPFVFDDRAAILENPSIRQLWPLSNALSPPSGGQSVSGRPLLNLSLAINYRLGGTNPTGYHVFNVVVHTLAALTLFGIVRRTWPRAENKGSDAGLLIAAGVALVWALHPLQTAAVTYVVQRAESMMGLFYLLTLYCFIRAVGTARRLVSPTAGSSDRRPCLPASTFRQFWFAGSIVSCLLGMATKEVMATAPVIVLLYDRTFVAGNFRRAWRERRGYYLGLAGTWLLLAWLLLGSHERGGTVGFASGVSAGNYLLTQCAAVVNYLKLSVWPHPLVFDYGERLVTRLTEVWPQALLLIALLGATAVALRSRPVVGFLGAWFFVILAPTSSVVPIASQTIAEHRMYLPLAAVIVALAAGAQALIGRRTFIALLMLGIFAGGLTIARNRTYRSEVSLWTDTAARVPDNARAHANLGSALLDAGRHEEAATAYNEAARLQPDSAEIRANLCHVYTRLERFAEAVEQGESAVRLAPQNSDARVNLASALVRLGRLKEAIEHYDAAHRAQPGSNDLTQALADTLLQQAQMDARARRLAEAGHRVAEALRLAPDHTEARFAEGNLAASAEDFDGAVKAYRRVLVNAPGHIGARNNLANVYLVTGRIDEAVVEYREVARLRPGDRLVEENLRRALEMQAGSTRAVR